MPCFTASPDRGAVRPQVPLGHSTLIPVDIIFRCPGGSVASSAECVSCPAEPSDPFVGILASSVSLRTAILIWGVVASSLCHSGFDVFMHHSPFLRHSGIVATSLSSLKNRMAPFLFVTCPYWYHESIVDLLSAAYFSGLKTDPDAFGLYNVS